MKHYHSIKPSVLLAGLLFSLVQQSACATDLELSLRPSNTELIQFEPLRICSTIRNTGHTSLRIRNLSGLEGCLQFYLARENREFMMVALPFMGLIDTSPRYIAVAPGGAVSQYEFLVFDQKRNSFVFAEPGTYMLRSVYVDPNGGRIESASVSIRVIETPNAEVVPSSLWRRRSVGLLMQGAERSSEGRETLLEIVQEHPNSIFTPYAALEIAKDAVKGTGSISLEAAERYFEIAMNCTNKTVREEVRVLRTEVLLRFLNRSVEAADLAEATLREFPESAYRDILLRARSKAGR